MTLHTSVDETSPGKIFPILVWVRVLVHVLAGVFTLSFIFPFISQSQKDRKIRLWSERLLNIFKLKLVVIGRENVTSAPALFAANHISWLDIHAINACKPIRFVAKSEVRSWPIFGWMAKQLGTVFIRRDSARHARQVVEQMAEVLKTESICIFPEGTSTNGAQVLPFKPNLFESALAAKCPIYPLSIRYFSRRTGLRSDSPAFIGDMGLLESMSRVIQDPGLVVQVRFLMPYAPSILGDSDRKQVAAYCQESIAQTL
ncbi:1-acyl-sn-glycerol-3-phosphate acyltransferase [Polynucleobacter sp. es-EL-1]|uniref:lysophospholipid acyltransferase family protein n=1 Tax=Polynucleobacter sp. es-EL-1 TaxID=1855652 RepID=UPI001BFD8BA3|nr:lysophospholipid acyltransferase family protein [Polynucleobacter sp. es-EL-1]QWE11275.1 1-acyl-sn-glycerol-3-phosphate acyltransferase [Polynucleobacter sp. es-EL-1]